MWWQTIKNVRDGVGRINDGWMLDNIICEVGDGASSLFWVDLWLEGKSLNKVYARLYELVGNKLVMLAQMFALDEELLGECLEQLTSDVLQVDRVDRCVWTIHIVTLSVLLILT